MYTHFRTEFVRQSQATIMRRVTMTQFMFIIVILVLGIGLFGSPWWTAPLLAAAGYVAGYNLRGEMVLKRALAYSQVQLRQAGGQPRVVNIAASWQTLRVDE